ncbi:MAG: hypothetical protein MOGMAGMI_02173 [Candidatus Omnitrophica bacterium]|nr:hypothetical protein [Candidatus Omnitrophota bacterium]
MNIRTLIAAAVVAALTGSGAALAAETRERAGRPCASKDLAGTWIMRGLTLSSQAVNPKDPGLSPYQRYFFDDKGHVKHLVSDRRLSEQDPAVDKFNRMGSTSMYTLDERGLLRIQHLESAFPEQCLCTVVLRDPDPLSLEKLEPEKRERIPKKGEIILTYLDRKGKPALTKSLMKASA